MKLDFKVYFTLQKKVYITDGNLEIMSTGGEEPQAMILDSSTDTSTDSSTDSSSDSSSNSDSSDEEKKKKKRKKKNGKKRSKKTKKENKKVKRSNGKGERGMDMLYLARYTVKKIVFTTF